MRRPARFYDKIALSLLACLFTWMSQAQQNQQLIAQLCAEKILPEAYCNDDRRSGSSYEILQQWLSRYPAYDEETGATIDELYTAQIIQISNKFWLKGDSAGWDYGRPPHPDTIQFYKKESQKAISTLQKNGLINAVQAKKLNRSLKENTLIHPRQTLSMAHALLREAAWDTGVFARNLIDSLRVVFPATTYQGADIGAFLTTVPEHFTLTLDAPLLSPQTVLPALEKLIKSMHPNLEPRLNWRLETQGFTSGCRIPIKRYEVVFGLPLGYAMDCTFELHAKQTADGPMLEAAAFSAADHLVNLLMQLEQNEGSPFVGFLMFNWKKTRDFLLQSGFQLPAMAFDPQRSGQIHFVRLTEEQYQRIKKMEIPFEDGVKMKLEETMVFHRYPNGLSSGAKVRIWQKLQASTVLNRHEPAAQSYLWANLSAYPIPDSLEMLRQLFLADYPDPYTRLNAVRQMFGGKISRLYQINLLKDVSRGVVHEKDFTDLRMENSDARMESFFYFNCAGKAFSANLNTRDAADLVVLTELAAA